MRKIFSINDKKDKNKILKLWIISVLSILFITLLGDSILDTYIFNLKILFDTEHYFNIGLKGYTQNYEFAFFPIIPLLIRFFNFFKIPIIGMIIFNNILCLLSTYLIYKILTEVYDINRKKSMMSCKFWLFSPIRVFTFVPYTESLFMFLSFLSFYLYKKYISNNKDNFQIKEPLLLGVSIGLSVATRSMGAILFFVIFVFVFIDMINSNNTKTKKVKIMYIILTYIPATIISCLYPIYLQIKVGSWRYFIDVQYEYWCREKGNIIRAISIDIKRLFETNFMEVKVMILLTFISLLLCFIFILLNILKNNFKQLDLILLCIFSILVMFSTQRNVEITVTAATTSFFRYIYGLIPMYLFIPDNSNKKFLNIVFILNILLFILVTFLFLGGKFVA